MKALILCGVLLVLCMLSPRFSRFFGIMLVLIALVMIPGVFPNPAVGWLLMIGVLIMGLSAWLIVRGMASHERERNATKIMDRVEELKTIRRAEQEKTFGHFKVRE